MFCFQVFFKDRRIGIHIDKAFILILLLMFILGYSKEYLISFFCILVHEVAHIVCTGWMGGRVYAVRVLAIGLNAQIEESMCSRMQKALIYLSGPLVNLCIAMIAWALMQIGKFNTGETYLFILLNLYLGIFNLIPILPMDGGKVLQAILEIKVGLFTASRVVRKASVFLSVFLMMGGVAQIYFKVYNFNLIFIALYLFFSLKQPLGMEAAFMNMKHVIYRRSRLLKRGAYPVRDLVVIQGMKLTEIIKSMDFDRFHIIHVLDEDLRLVRSFTEQEVIDAATKYHSEITFEELIKTEEAQT